MRSTQFHVDEESDAVRVSSPRIAFEISKNTGKISRVGVHDGNKWIELLPDRDYAGDSWDLPVRSVDVDSADLACVRVSIKRSDENWEFTTGYEIFPAGYLVCDFTILARKEHAVPQALNIDIPLTNDAVFSHTYIPINFVNDPEDRTAYRAFGIDFSSDDRPVTSSINLLVEQVVRGMQGRPQKKQIIEGNDSRTLRWNMSDRTLNPVPAGYRYSNRWGLSVTSIRNEANPVRGQRIYHWYGRYPRFPADDLIEEMAEYGCSILIIHMPSFSHITGSIPVEPAEMQRVVEKAHSLGMKVLPYCVPQLISIKADNYEDFLSSRTENLRVWHCLDDTQIVFYESDENFDCDELCLRSPGAYEFCYKSVVECVELYGLDGIYVDFAWPAAGICHDTSHSHEAGIYNFYDYWRILRDWRNALGEDAVMIGHGGGLLVSSDFVEAFDACLTGEAQRELDPYSVGQHFGSAPTLWTMHRRKQEIFRSAATIPQLVREGITPHTGLGVLGTSIVASLDPAHNRDLLPLWQMWRAFPVERGRIYTYHNPGAVTVDNDEVYYTLFVTDDPCALLVLSNSGGPYHDANPSVGVTALIDENISGLSGELRVWRLKGRSYETFRISELPIATGARVEVPELLLHETVGFIFSPGDPPEELYRLQRHLDSRWERLGDVYRKKSVRNTWLDDKLDGWARLPQAQTRVDYREFLEGRVAE